VTRDGWCYTPPRPRNPIKSRDEDEDEDENEEDLEAMWDVPPFDNPRNRREYAVLN
jgi:hypothetical protein